MKHFYIYQKLSLIILAIVLSTYFSIAQDYDFVSTDELGYPMVVMEAEHYSELVSVGDITETTGSTWVDTSTTPEGYSGDGFMKAYNPGSAPARFNDAYKNAGYLRYNINFTAGGTYYIWARASRTGGSDDSFHAALADDVVIIDSVDMIAFEGDNLPKVNTNNWVWVYYSHQYDEPAQVTVPIPGVFNFRVYIRERGFKIDKIILTEDMFYIPDSTNTGPDETLKPTGVESIDAGNPNLFKVYPNPFSSGSVISYQLDNPQHVSIKLYNEVGQELRILVNEMQQPGKHEFKWNLTASDVNDLKEGIYFVRFNSGNSVKTVKTIITR